MRIATWNMSGPANALTKWAFVETLEADITVLQEARLPMGASGHVSRRKIKPALDRDDVVIVTRQRSEPREAPEEALGQALEVRCDGALVFGVRSYLQVKEYYPKALLRIIDAISKRVTESGSIPTAIGGDFNASLDQGPGRDWTPPFRRLRELGFFDVICLRSECDEATLPCRLNHGKTFRNSRGQYRIDHLYVNRVMAMHLRHATIEVEGWRLSDHCPVIADFDLA